MSPFWILLEPRMMEVVVTTGMKKALREMQTLHAGCSNAGPNFFILPQTPSQRRGISKI